MPAEREPSLVFLHEIRSTDHALGRLLAAVAEVSSRPTAVIVAADHGDAFHMGYQFHGNDLFEDALRIPLLVRVPGRPPGEVDSVVTLLDLAPTILTLTETPILDAYLEQELLAPRRDGRPTAHWAGLVQRTRRPSSRARNFSEPSSRSVSVATHRAERAAASPPRSAPARSLAAARIFSAQAVAATFKA